MGSYKPWYIGKTKAKKGFANEVFNARNIKLYRSLFRRKNGEPHLFLIARRKNKHAGFVTSPSKEHVRWLEFSLLALGWRVNKKIENDKGRKFVESVRVRGIL